MHLNESPFSLKPQNKIQPSEVISVVSGCNWFSKGLMSFTEIGQTLIECSTNDLK